jgi:membrane protein DedA with SNARE-associated domain
VHFNIQQYGYPGIFFAFLLEMVGIPFPGETILTLSGMQWKQGTFSFMPLVLVTLSGTLIGSNFAYMIGRFLGRNFILRFGKYVGITNKKFNTADEKFKKYSVLVVFGGKSVAGIRVFSAYLAGINRMSFWKFTFYNSTGTLLWIIVFILLGRYANIFWEQYHHFLQNQLLLLIFLIIFLVMITTVLMIKQHRTKKIKSM